MAQRRLPRVEEVAAALARLALGAVAWVAAALARVAAAWGRSGWKNDLSELRA